VIFCVREPIPPPLLWSVRLLRRFSNSSGPLAVSNLLISAVAILQVVANAAVEKYSVRWTPDPAITNRIARGR